MTEETKNKLEKFNDLHIGGEPSFEKIPQLEQQAHYDTLISRSLNWYAANRELKDSQEYFIKYCEKNNLSIRKDVPHDLIKNIGFLCRMLHRGLLETPKIVDRIKQRYDEVKDWEPTKQQKQVSDVVPVEKKALRILHSDQFISLITDVDELFESILNEKLNEKKIDLTTMTTKDLRLTTTYLESIRKEYQSIDSLDEEYKACYPGKRIINRLLTFIDDIIKRIEDIIKASKITTSKPQPASKQVASMKCLKEYDNIKGLHLEKIVGARAMLLFNVKYRKIMYIEAKSTFTCKGASFFEVDKWICKTSRKPEQQVKDWVLLTKPQLKAALTAVSGVNSTPQIRMNEDTILLKVFN